MEITINAPAKINLYLNVLNKRKDDYHNVEMVMQTVNLFDVITIKKTNKTEITLTSTYNFKNKEENTAYIAAKNFLEYINLKNEGIHINIQKKIPLGAGLAGGSSDAAAVLLGLNKLFECNFTKNKLAKLGEKIGADVPFCIFGGTMLATGIGTILSPLPPIKNCYFVIVKPKFSISTKTAYQSLNNILSKKNKSIKNIISAIKSNNLKTISKNIYNKFEEVIKNEELSQIKNLLNNKGALNSCMTGTGSAIYGIFDNKEKAIYCKKVLDKYYKESFLVIPFFH